MTPLEAATRADLNHHLGTELRGVQLTMLDDAGIGALRQLVAERGVVAVRGQDLTLEEQIELGRRLGPLHIHPLYADPQHREALRIHTDERSVFSAGEGWHSDVSCDEEPPAISILRFDVLPDHGGDTAFASSVAAFERLSAPVQDLLRGLRAVHSGDLPYRQVYGTAMSQEVPRASHPVVIAHPVTGRESLFVNSGFTERIEGVSRAESAALLAMLFAHIASGVVFQTRIRWELGTVTLWDNRSVQHYASWDYFPATRSGWRVTTRGGRPVAAERAAAS